MDKQSRLQDDPVIQGIAKGVEDLKEGQKKIEDYLLHPETGVFSQIQELKTWRDKIVDPWRKALKSWGWKIAWALLLILATGGTIFGLKLG